MIEVGIQVLPQYNKWPARLLGLESFKKEPRDISKILREYDTDKYKKYLEYLEANPALKFDDMRWFERGISPDKEMCISMDKKLFVGKAGEVFAHHQDIFLEKMAPLMQECDCVVELGAGFGHNLFLLQEKYPKHLYIGGEVSANGIELGKKLAKGNHVEFLPFNFYDEDWSIFEKTHGRKVLVLTYHAVEMIPKAEDFFLKLEKYKNNIVHVACFEPLYESYSDDLLSLLRKAYINMNDYNTNFLSALKSSPSRWQSLAITEDFFGANPLFPEAFIHWQFK